MDRYDVWSRFARSHLFTPLRRAVYLWLVGAASGPASLAEVALAVGSREEDVAEVVHAFEEAGIVEAVGAHGSPRYRWNANLTYLPTTLGESSDLIDPVCRMAVTSDSPYVASDEAGRSIRFCSRVCLDTFRASVARMNSSQPEAER